MAAASSPSSWPSTRSESCDNIGGAARTVDFPTSQGPLPVDIGVSIMEPRGYPNVFALLDRLGVATDVVSITFGASFGPGDEWAQGRLGETPLGRRIADECSRFELDAFRAESLPVDAEALERALIE